MVQVPIFAIQCETAAQRKSKTTGAETEHYLNTDMDSEHRGAPVIQKEEEDSFSVMSPIAP